MMQRCREHEDGTFTGLPHGFAGKPGPESDGAHALMKAFIARQLSNSRACSEGARIVSNNIV